MSRDPEDLLRDALRDDAPVGAGSFDDVRARARSLDRRARARKAGAAAVVVLAAIAVSIPLLTGDNDDKQRVVTQPHPETTITPHDDAPGIWPFATAAQADDKAIELPFNPTDPVATASEFLKSVVGMSVGDLSSHPDGREMLVVDRVGTRTTTVELAKLGTSDRWTVVGASADGLVLDEVDVREHAVHVAGRATAFEGTVQVRVVLRAQALPEIGNGVVTGEMGELKPFDGDVSIESFPTGGDGLGAVIAVTTSAKDGSIEQVAAAPIRWTSRVVQAALPATGAALADDEIVAVLTYDMPGEPGLQQIVVLDAANGSVRRRLRANVSTAEGGVLGLEVSPDRRTVVATVATSACDTQVESYAADGSAKGILDGLRVAGERTALSPDGRWLATATDDKCDAHDEIEVRDLTGKTSTRRFDVLRGEQPTAQIGAMTWEANARILFDVHLGTAPGSTVQLWDMSPNDGRGRVLGGPDGGKPTWSLPVRDAKGDTHVFVSTGTIEYFDPAKLAPSGVGFQTGPDVVSYTFLRDVAYWVSSDGVVHSSDGRTFGVKVNLLAS